MRRIGLLGMVLLLVLFSFSAAALADKAATGIEGPASAVKGSEVTIRVTVTHSSNAALHHTEWLKVTANNREIARWNFTASQRPEAAVFIREVKVKVTEGLEFRAEASCNVHGSKGPSTLKVSVTE